MINLKYIFSFCKLLKYTEDLIISQANQFSIYSTASGFEDDTDIIGTTKKNCVKLC